LTQFGVAERQQASSATRFVLVVRMRGDRGACVARAHHLPAAPMPRTVARFLDQYADRIQVAAILQGPNAASYQDAVTTVLRGRAARATPVRESSWRRSASSSACRRCWTLIRSSTRRCHRRPSRWTRSVIGRDGGGARSPRRVAAMTEVACMSDATTTVDQDELGVPTRSSTTTLERVIIPARHPARLRGADSGAGLSSAPPDTASALAHRTRHGVRPARRCGDAGQTIPRMSRLTVGPGYAIDGLGREGPGQ